MGDLNLNFSLGASGRRDVQPPYERMPVFRSGTPADSQVRLIDVVNGLC